MEDKTAGEALTFGTPTEEKIGIAILRNDKVWMVALDADDAMKYAVSSKETGKPSNNGPAREISTISDTTMFSAGLKSLVDECLESGPQMMIYSISASDRAGHDGPIDLAKVITHMPATSAEAALAEAVVTETIGSAVQPKPRVKLHPANVSEVLGETAEMQRKTAEMRRKQQGILHAAGYDADEAKELVGLFMKDLPADHDKGSTRMLVTSIMGGLYEDPDLLEARLRNSRMLSQAIEDGSISGGVAAMRFHIPGARGRPDRDILDTVIMDKDMAVVRKSDFATGSVLSEVVHFHVEGRTGDVQLLPSGEDTGRINTTEEMQAASTTRTMIAERDPSRTPAVEDARRLVAHIGARTRGLRYEHDSYNEMFAEWLDKNAAPEPQLAAIERTPRWEKIEASFAAIADEARDHRANRGDMLAIAAAALDPSEAAKKRTFLSAIAKEHLGL